MIAQVAGWIVCLVILLISWLIISDLKKSHKRATKTHRGLCRVYRAKIDKITKEMNEGFTLKNKAIQFLTDENEEFRK